MKLYNSLGDKGGEFIALSNASLIYWDMGELDKALINYNKILYHNTN